MMLWLLSLMAFAGPIHPVRAGETIESIALEVGDLELAPAIRELNGLQAGQQPVIGTLLELPEQAGVGQQAFLLSRDGTVRVTDGAGGSLPSEQYDPVPLGGQVCTGERSFATVRMATQCTSDGTQTDDIQLQPDTCIVVENLWSDADSRSTVVRVRTGSISIAENRDAAGSVTIVTPSGVTTGEDGGYRVTVEDEAARTEALTAPVAVQGAGVEVAVAAGQGARVRTGEAPSDPIDLLAPGQLIRPEDGQALQRADFGWTPVDGALGYRFEVGEIGRAHV